MIKSIRIRLYPNKNQIDYINSLMGSSRFVYNQCLNYKMLQYNNHNKNISLGELGKYLVNLKLEYTWLKESHSKVLQQSIINLMDAYKSFFKNGNGFPKFKSKHSKQSCRFPSDAVRYIKGNRIKIIKKLDNIHFKCSKKDEIYLNKNPHLIKCGTLTKTKSNKYYFSIIIDKPNKELQKPKNNIIGLDLGIKSFIIDSNGNEYENIKIKRNNQKKLSKLHRELSRKQKGSSNRNKAKIKLARQYEKLNNIKENYLHHITNQLLNENQVIVIEDLNVKGMMRNTYLSKSIQELSLYRFKQMLEYKSKWYGRDLIIIDKWFPSSKLCSNCGHKNDKLTLNDREWQCLYCGTKHNRDFNAAVNIKKEGERIIGLSSPELKPLESMSLDTR